MAINIIKNKFNDDPAVTDHINNSLIHLMNGTKGVNIVECGETITGQNLVDIVNGKAYNTINSGADYEFSTTYYTTPTAISIDTNKVLILFENLTGTYISGCVATVSGTTITYGSVRTFTDSTTNGWLTIDNITKIATNQVVIAYTETGGHAVARVLIISGTTISAGVPWQISETHNIYPVISRYASNKVLCIYNHPDYAGNVYYNVLTISGDQVAVGTATQFTELGTYDHFTLTYVGNMGGNPYIVVTYNTASGGGYLLKIRVIKMYNNTIYNISDEYEIGRASYDYATRVAMIDNFRFAVAWADSYGTLVQLFSHVDYKITGHGDVYMPNVVNGGGDYINLELIDTNKLILVDALGDYIYLLQANNLNLIIDKLRTQRGVKQWYFMSTTKINTGVVFECFSDGSDGQLHGQAKIIDINNYDGIALTPQFTNSGTNYVPYLEVNS